VEGVKAVAELMAVAARTAPKSGGHDFVVIEILEGKEVARLGRAMIEYGRKKGIPGFERDGQNVIDSEGVVVIGIKDADVMDLNCAACGEEACIVINTFEGEFKGPNCALRHLDLGIALGSAVKTASMLNVDNRIMYRAGVLARALGQIDADFVMGIPLSATGKSIYYDRAPKAAAPAKK
jgi:uncharacterized ferredoxin-like protein